jgi:hypothetical protein
MYCLGYVQGFTDAAVVCIPKGVVVHQVLDVVVRFLRAHPAVRNMDASKLAHTALLEAWPCKPN